MRVRQGDFTHKIAVGTVDQLGELAESFNTMTASIEDLLLQAAEKKRLEEEQRKLAEQQKKLEDERRELENRYQLKDEELAARRAADAEAAEKARRLVSQLLTFSRQDQAETSRIALSNCIQEAVTLVRNILPSSITIRVLSTRRGSSPSASAACRPTRSDPGSYSYV